MIDVEVLYSVAGVATQILLSHHSDDLLIDAGDGVVRDLSERRYDFYRLKAVVLTHEDFDHISGLYALLSFLRNFYRHRMARSEELIIATPKPVHHVHLFLQPPIMYRPTMFPVRLVQVSDGQTLTIGSLTVRAFEVDHTKRDEAVSLGYGVTDKEGFKVVLSGDTRPCESLRREVLKADIAVLEATGEEHQQPRVRDQGHMTSAEAEELGGKAKKAIYVHRPPSWFV